MYSELFHKIDGPAVCRSRVLEPPATGAGGIRLLNIRSRRFESFCESSFPPYAVISYVWGTDWAEEVLFADINAQWESTKPGFQRFLAACNLALVFGLQYLWCDSFCIDQSSSEDISQASRCMPIYYQRAHICLVYLPGFPRLEHRGICGPSRTGYQQLSAFSNARSFQFLAFVCRLEFCMSECRFRSRGTFRILELITSAVRASLGDDFQHHATIFDMERARYEAPSLLKEGRHQERARSLVLVVSNEGKKCHQEGDWSRSEQRLTEEIGETPETSTLCAWLDVKGNQTHVEVLGETLQVFDKVFQRHVSCGYPEPARGHQPDFDEHAGSFGSFVIVNPGPALSGPHTGKPQNHSSLQDAAYCNPTVGQDSVEGGSGPWEHICAKVLSHGASDTLPEDTPSVTKSSEQPKGFAPEQDIQTSTRNGHHPSGSKSEDWSGPIRSWIASTSPGQSAADPNSWAPEDLTPKLNLEHGAWDNGSSKPCLEPRGRNRDRWLCFDEWTNLESSLGPEHPLIRLKCHMVQNALHWFRAWKIELHRSQERQRQSESRECEHCGQDGTQQCLCGQGGMPMKPKEPLEFACPYYKKDPSKYSDCLKRCRLKTMDDVKDHIWQRHRLPFYCPVCKKDFPTASGRDRHIVKRLCTLQDSFPHEGVSDDQRRQLFRRHDGIGPKKHWFRIWKLLLPNEPPPKSAVLKDDAGQEAVVFREFWSRHGEALIVRSLKNADLSSWDRRKEERDLASLYAEVFNEAMDRIVGGLNFARSRIAC